MTDNQIRQLCTEAAAVGDLRQVDICHRALVSDAEIGGYDHALGALGLSQAQARELCVDVITEARARSAE